MFNVKWCTRGVLDLISIDTNRPLETSTKRDQRKKEQNRPTILISKFQLSLIWIHPCGSRWYRMCKEHERNPLTSSTIFIILGKHMLIKNKKISIHVQMDELDEIGLHMRCVGTWRRIVVWKRLGGILKMCVDVGIVNEPWKDFRNKRNKLWAFRPAYQFLRCQCEQRANRHRR